MFEQAELPGTEMGARLMQKERLKSPRKSPVLKKSGHLGHFGNFSPNGHLGRFGQPFPKNQGGHAEKKFHSGPCLHQRDRATSECGGNWTHQKPGIKKIDVRGFK